MLHILLKVRRKIIERYGETSLYREGLNVITTIDPGLQRIAINALRVGLENYDKRHGWRGPIANLGKLSIKNNYEEIRRKYQNFPGLHNRTVAIVDSINDVEINL